jgi:hypothetical protein
MIIFNFLLGRFLSLFEVKNAKMLDCYSSDAEYTWNDGN